jgi:hypothetical protein
VLLFCLRRRVSELIAAQPWFPECCKFAGALANASNMLTQHTTEPDPVSTGMAKGAAATTAATVTGAAAVVSNTATDAYDKARDYVPGRSESKSNTEPYHQTQTLPSQDKQGQLPYSGPTGGVGALPGTVSEEAIAILPEEKGMWPHRHLTKSANFVYQVNPDPLAGSEFGSAERNTTPTNPYYPDSPYSNVEANAVQQPKSTAADIEDKAEKAEGVKEKIAPSTGDLSGSDKSANGAPKKSGFMDKLKAQSKILSGKISNNPNKVAEGQALKSGTHA